MKTQELEWIVGCLHNYMLYPYFRDKYALELLGLTFENQVEVVELKRSKWAKLLTRPVVKDLLAASGNGILTRQHLTNYWGEETHFLRLTVGRWGKDTKRKIAHYQVSRPGLSLVLQVNFDGTHDQALHRYLGSEARDLLLCADHPIHDSLNTMGGYEWTSTRTSTKFWSRKFRPTGFGT